MHCSNLFSLKLSNVQRYFRLYSISSDINEKKFVSKELTYFVGNAQRRSLMKNSWTEFWLTILLAKSKMNSRLIKSITGSINTSKESRSKTWRPILQSLDDSSNGCKWSKTCVKQTSRHEHSRTSNFDRNDRMQSTRRMKDWRNEMLLLKKKELNGMKTKCKRNSKMMRRSSF